MQTTQFNATMEMSRLLEKQLGSAVTGFTTSAVEALATKYGFDSAEAISHLGLSDFAIERKTQKKAKAPKEKKAKAPKVKRMVPGMPIPFCGQVCGDWCNGIRLNHGLYTQCTMAKGANGFCKTCQKQADKNENNKPNYGVIQDRLEGDALEYRDPKGKQVSCYGNVMKKLQITRADAEAEAAKFGWTIPEEQFEERKAKKGRPSKKDATASDTDDEAPKPKAKRGRPKKSKKVVSNAAIGDDLIASLVAQAENKVVAEEDDESSVSTSESETEKPKEKVAKKKSKKGGRKVKVPEHFTGEDSAWQAMTGAERKQWKKDNKPQLSDEEKAAKKKAAADKRKATMAAKKAAAEQAPLVPEQELTVDVDASTAPTTPEQDDSSAVTTPDAPVKVQPAVTPEKHTAIPMQALDDADSSDDEAEAEVEVVKFEHEGTEYLKAADGILYDPETQDAVGVWNEETKTIDELDDLDLED